ncbi:MAG: hypothetical protein Q8M15_07350 [Bacteroidota bacterium]|nr:hypothetical protein [Bacteroidota bacterium]
MARETIIIAKNTHETTLIGVDSSNAAEILQYVLSDSVNSEFKQIISILKDNLRNKEKYCKANVSEKAKNMYEMRFTNNGRNDRIYCQEMTESQKRVIIMIELYQGKKSQEIPKGWKNRIETMGTYKYEIKK